MLTVFCTFLLLLVRSFALSSPIFLPYFSHLGWEKYGRNDAEETVKERRLEFSEGEAAGGNETNREIPDSVIYNITCFSR